MDTSKWRYEDVENAFSRAFDMLRKAIEEDSSDGNITDLAGLMRKQAADAGAMKRSLMSEIPVGVPIEGKRYEVYQPSKTTRTYSSEKILADLSRNKTDYSLSELIRDLIAADVVKLTWSWTNLRKLFHIADIPLIVVGHEIHQYDDDAHVGEVEGLGSPDFKSITDA